MSSTELNPEAVVLQQLQGQWQKIAMLVLWKLKGTAVLKITGAEIEAFTAAFEPGLPVLFTHGLYDGFELSIVTEEAAARLAAHNATMQGHA